MKAHLRLWIFIITFILALAACRASQPAGKPTRKTSTETAAAPIRVALRGDLAPFSYWDETTRTTVGFDVDLMEALAAKIDRRAAYDVIVNRQVMLDSMTACQHDVHFANIVELPSSGSGVCWEWRFAGEVVQRYCSQESPPVTFTQPYYKSGLVIVVRSDNASLLTQGDLAGRQVGIDLAFRKEAEFLQLVGRSSLHFFNPMEKAYQALLDGDLEAVLDDFPKAVKAVSKNPAGLKIIGQPFSHFTSYALAVCSSQAPLAAALDTALEALQADGTYDRLVQKWLAGAGK